MAELLGIARKAASRAPMEEIPSVAISIESGVDGDFRGRVQKRQVTVLSKDAWNAVCAQLGSEIPWTARRANLLVDGVSLENADGMKLRVGEVELRITGEAGPCHRMEEQYAGLRAAMTPDWRGGVGCTVIVAGTVRLGDKVELVKN